MKTLQSLVKNRYILNELVIKNVKTQYRNSWLGMVWTVLNPLLNMLVMWLVFKQFFGRNDPLFPIYILTGNIMMASLSSATNGALQSIVGNRGLLTRVKIDPYLFPLSRVLSSLINFFFSFIALLIIMLVIQIFGISNVFSFRIFAVILMIPAFILFQYGIGLFLSAVFVFARDIKHLYSVFMTLWTYITPIFYKPETIFDAGSLAGKIIKLNPMYYFLKFFRDAIYMGWSNSPILDIAILYLIGLVSFLIGASVFKIFKKHFIMNM